MQKGFTMDFEQKVAKFAQLCLDHVAAGDTVEELIEERDEALESGSLAEDSFAIQGYNRAIVELQ